MADLMNKTIASIMTALIAIVLLASAFIPTAVNQINALIDMFTKEGTTDPTVMGFATLMFVVITMTIIGVLLGVIKGYISDGAEVYETVTEER